MKGRTPVHWPPARRATRHPPPCVCPVNVRADRFATFIAADEDKMTGRELPVIYVLKTNRRVGS